MQYSDHRQPWWPWMGAQLGSKLEWDSTHPCWTAGAVFLDLEWPFQVAKGAERGPKMAINAVFYPSALFGTPKIAKNTQNGRFGGYRKLRCNEWLKGSVLLVGVESQLPSPLSLNVFLWSDTQKQIQRATKWEASRRLSCWPSWWGLGGSSWWDP